jgi:uncharacterized protein (DUF305 family)
MIRSLALAALVLLAAPALAQQQHHNHGAPAAAGADSPSTRAYKAANDRMHKGMDLKFTGDADRDFAAGMIPHHQGAIDMAKTVLQHGKDPDLRKLAQDIIKAQESEIAFLKAWLAKQK